ncbi:MAG: hypothetical protein LBN29_04000 [Mediterranea sp.]|nr:hypothetical protein [Mediterranea sp.]
MNELILLLNTIVAEEGRQILFAADEVCVIGFVRNGECIIPNPHLHHQLLPCWKNFANATKASARYGIYSKTES